MRRFTLNRTVDHTGVSGTGVVAEGIEFSDKSTVVHWVVPGKPRSTVIYRSVKEVMEIHNHVDTKNEGGTTISWIDN